MKIFHITFLVLNFEAQTKPDIEQLQRQYDALNSSSMLARSELTAARAEKDDLSAQVDALKATVAQKTNENAGYYGYQ